MMKIAFVTPEYVTESNFDGGLANYLHRIAISLVGLGASPVIFVVSERDEHIVHKGVDIYRVRLRDHFILRILNYLTKNKYIRPIKIIWQSYELNRRLKQIHRKTPFDAVQYASYLSTGLFRIRKLLSIVRISSFEPLIRFGYEKYPDRSQKIIEWLELKAIMRADGLFAPSWFLCNIVESEIKRKVVRILSPYVNDVESNDYTVYEDRLRGKTYLLFFGSLGVLKGLSDIAEIVEGLLMENKDLYMVFAGKDMGYKGGTMREYIEKKAGEARNRLMFLGKLHHDQLYPVIECAKLVILPSRVDNFPNACLESFAYKKVVVATRGASFEEIIEDGVSGFLSGKENPEDLRRTIRLALSKTDNELRKIGEGAFEKLKELRPEVVSMELLEFIKALKGQGHG